MDDTNHTTIASSRGAKQETIIMTFLVHKVIYVCKNEIKWQRFKKNRPQQKPAPRCRPQ